MGNDTKDTANLPGDIDDNKFLQYYKDLWNERISTEPNGIEFTEDRNFETNAGDIITMDDVNKVLKLLKFGKSAGVDKINSELYKHAPDDFKERILNFLNNVYNNQKIPHDWRNAVVIPLYKKGDKRNPENYRGISILNTCYKIYAKILNFKLQWFSEKFISETQNGFRKGRSCTDPTFCLKLLIEKRRKFNLETHILFIRGASIK